MSKLRATVLAGPGKFAPRGITAYLMVLNAVKIQKGLIHGKLDDEHGAHCAVGGYFDINRKGALASDLIDEIAAVNDSVPTLTAFARKLHVMRWLRWRLRQLGYPA